jgi:hypothetical protein
MWKKRLLRIAVLISIFVLAGCKSKDESNGKNGKLEDTSAVAVEDTTDATDEETKEQDVTLCYWDIAEMKIYRNTVKMEDPTPEKVLQLLTKEIEATGMESRLPKDMVIDEVVIDQDKLATVNVTLDEKKRGNYTTSAWAEAMEYTIVHTLIENESFGIDKVVFGDTLNEITTFVDNIYFEIKGGEVVTVDR